METEATEIMAPAQKQRGRPIGEAEQAVGAGARRQPRVAIVARLDRPGGVQSCAFSLIKGLNALSITPDVVWDMPPNPALLAACGLQAGFHCVRFPFPSTAIDRLPETLRYLAWMANGIDAGQLGLSYDFYYIFYNGFLAGPQIPHLRYLSGPPLLPQLERFPRGARALPIRFFKALYRHGLRRAAPVYEFHRHSPYVINSHYTAGLFREAHGVDLPVVHPPVDVPAGAQNGLPGLAQRDTLTFFSRLASPKRPEMVLDLALRHPELRCVMMGSVAPHQRAYFQGLQQRARQAGRSVVATLDDSVVTAFDDSVVTALDSSVDPASPSLRSTASPSLRSTEAPILFLDTPASARVREELQRTRFFVFPARNEHFGMATVEAIARGAIPYVHDSGGQREIVPDPRLRFTDDTFFDGFAALLRLPESELSAIQTTLLQHILSFSESAYLSKMLAYLSAAHAR